MKQKQMYESLWIGGSWVPPSLPGTIDVVSPSSEEAIGRVQEAGEPDVDAAVDAARAALADPGGWSQWEPARRAEVLERLADRMADRGAEFAELVSAQNGIPIGVTMRAEASNPAFMLRYYGAMIRDEPIEDGRTGMYGGTTIMRRGPIGVVAAIIPWNAPQTLLSFKLAPALAAGCAIVIKPSPETVLDCFLLAEILDDAGLPPGVVSIVPGGRELGAYLVNHPGVDKVAFTGSSAAGRSIARDCGGLLRPVTLELGGKSAAILLPDVDLTASMEALFTATMLGNGEICFLSTRVLAPRSRYDEVVEAFTDMASAATVGDALDERTMVGPLVSAGHRERVERYITHGKASGARLTTGGGRPAGHPRGWFVDPTVFADVDNRDLLAREEIFGPVVTITAYTDEDEAVRLANDSEFGLSGVIFTADRDRGLALARRVETGTIGVNGYLPDLTAPFGGIKDSGIGRELGQLGLTNYQQLKTIYLH
jgi:acyl-CoA reductase-like NAD-dependent aldehyde dehydrogenase